MLMKNQTEQMKAKHNKYTLHKEKVKKSVEPAN